jgi:flagellar biosynthesis/type III secretory pathway protein FliH
LARGQAEADRVVDQARQEASAIRERARREGLQEFVEAEVEAFREVMAEVARELSQEFLVRWKGLELEAARLCVDLAANVVRKVVAEDDGVVVETVREGLARIPAARAVTIRVSPDCQAAVAAAAPALAQELLYGVALEVVADDTVAAGGALLQSSNGEVDLLLETQIARLREAAAAAIERELAQDEGGVARARTPTGGDDSHAAPADSLANDDYLDTEVHR